jgi:hypothetical protein
MLTHYLKALAQGCGGCIPAHKCTGWATHSNDKCESKLFSPGICCRKEIALAQSFSCLPQSVNAMKCWTNMKITRPLLDRSKGFGKSLWGGALLK